MTTTSRHDAALELALAQDSPSDPFVVDRDVPEDRWSIVWRAKWAILLITVLLTAATYGVSTVLPATYASSGQVVISSQTSSRSALDSVSASNLLAAQYAPVARSAAVVDAAAKQLGVPAGTIASHVSASTLSNQNIIAISVQADSAGGAHDATQAVLDALAARIESQGKDAVKAYDAQVKSQSKPLDDAIDAANAAVDKATKEAASASDATRPLRLQQVASAQSLLSNLQTQKQTQLATAAASAPQPPAADVLAPATDGARVAPKPVLYSAIAFVVSLLLVTEIAVARGRRRGGARARRRRRASA